MSSFMVEFMNSRIWSMPITKRSVSFPLSSLFVNNTAGVVSSSF